MKILALETSTGVGSVAILEDENIIAETANRSPMNLLSWLAPAAQKLIADSGWGFNDLDLIAVGTGPGSFTGVRLELSTARTLAQVLNIPLYGISSLDALAFQALPFHGTVIACMDARRGEFFAGFYEATENSLVQTGEASADLPQNIAGRAALQKGPWILIGDAGKDQAVFADRLPTMKTAPDETGIIKASSIGRLAIRRKSGMNGNPFEVHPVYIRASAAEIARLAGQA